jgi:hypothetical protein
MSLNRATTEPKMDRISSAVAEMLPGPQLSLNRGESNAKVGRIVQPMGESLSGE